MRCWRQARKWTPLLCCPLLRLALQGSLSADAAQHLAAAGPPARGSGHSGGSGGYEPTMTIATREAFAALNKMFKVGLCYIFMTRRIYLGVSGFSC